MLELDGVLLEQVGEDGGDTDISSLISQRLSPKTNTTQVKMMERDSVRSLDSSVKSTSIRFGAFGKKQSMAAKVAKQRRPLMSELMLWDVMGSDGGKKPKKGDRRKGQVRYMCEYV